VIGITLRISAPEMLQVAAKCPTGTDGADPAQSMLSNSRFSPDPHAIRRGKVKFLSRLNLESRIPRIDVAYRGGPVLPWGMRVRHHFLPQGRVPHFRSPVLTEGDEELFVA
jgi:hypothetical protein